MDPSILAALIGIFSTTILGLFTLLLNEHFKRASNLASERWNLKYELMKKIGLHLAEIDTVLYYIQRAKLIYSDEEEIDSNKILLLNHFVIKPSLNKRYKEGRTSETLERYFYHEKPTEDQVTEYLGTLMTEIKWAYTAMVQELLIQIGDEKWNLGLIAIHPKILIKISDFIDELQDFFDGVAYRNVNYNELKDKIRERRKSLQDDFNYELECTRKSWKGILANDGDYPYCYHIYLGK